MGKLTSKTVESIAKAATPGKTNDGDGLYVQVSKSGGTSWIFRDKLDGRGREGAFVSGTSCDDDTLNKPTASHD